MQEHACCGHDEKPGGAQLGRRVRIKCLNALLHTHKRRSGTLDLAKSEIGVGKDQTSGKAQRRFVAVKVAFCDRCSIFGPSAEISKFGAGDLAQVRVRNGRHRFGCLPGRKGCVHKWHWQKKRLRFLGRSAARLSRILWACGILRNGPAAAEFFCAGDAPVAREFLHAALRKLPALGCFCHADINHDAFLLCWFLIVL